MQARTSLQRGFFRTTVIAQTGQGYASTFSQKWIMNMNVYYFTSFLSALVFSLLPSLSSSSWLLFIPFRLILFIPFSFSSLGYPFLNYVTWQPEGPNNGFRLSAITKWMLQTVSYCWNMITLPGGWKQRRCPQVRRTLGHQSCVLLWKTPSYTDRSNNK